MLGHSRSDGDEILDNPDFAGSSVPATYGTLGGDCLRTSCRGAEPRRAHRLYPHGMGALDVDIGNRRRGKNDPLHSAWARRAAG